MKKIVSLIFIFLFTCTYSQLFSQKNDSLLFGVKDRVSFEGNPKGMQFVPMGSFEMVTESGKKIISIQAFWMSNEITNKEFREFTDYAKLHGNDSIYWFQKSKNIQENKIIYKYSYKEIAGILIDSMAMPKEYPENSKEYAFYKNYFTDKKFDHYPVVGVSYQSARFYCIWKTNMENLKLKKEGKQLMNDYRIPTDEEWCYAADICKNTKQEHKPEIKKSKSGKKNKLSLHNLFGNVSEWTSTTISDKKKQLRGASWKNKNKNNFVLPENSSNGHTGFRIVRTFIGQ